MHYNESELHRMIQTEISREDNNDYMVELEQEFREMFDSAIVTGKQIGRAHV